MKLYNHLILIVLMSITTSIWSNPHGVLDQNAVDAYGQYWKNFDEYESKRIQNQKSKLTLAWDQIKIDLRDTSETYRKAQVEELKLALKNYRLYLEENPDAANRPNVLYNLAYTLNLIGRHLSERDQPSGIPYREEALSVLNTIEVEYRYFSKKEELFYLQATILEILGQDQQSLKKWRQLASLAKNTIYGAYAQIAIGDRKFEQEQARESLRHYKTALSIIKKLSPTAADIDYEKVRVQYRIAWASYRSADLGLSIATAIELLQPGRVLRKVSVKKAIESDAMELIGDALYENNEMAYTKATLGRKVLSNYASGITMRILKRYLAGSIDRNIIELGSYVVDKFPKARHLPDILTILAGAYERTDQKELRLESLEKLAIMLPKGSLWRNFYSGSYETISNMEKKAFAANVILASHYYKTGMINANASSFAAASSYYQTLIEFAPNHADSNQWRLKQGNSYYFAGRNTDAQQIYSGLINSKRIDKETLQVASFQSLLALHKTWEEEYSRRSGGGVDAERDPIVLQFVTNLEQAVDHFANRFPKSKFSVDGLIMAASANRDMNRLTQANNFWQRVLVSNPNPNQRMTAIRGLVYYLVAKGDHQESITAISRYLMLENWRKLGRGLKSELESVLLTTVQNESDRLNTIGEVEQAARLLLRIAKDFPHLKKRDTLERDAAYMLAIGGEWQEALSVSNIGIGRARHRHKADLYYLKARALEYQMRFPLAAEAYLEFGKKYRKHSRSDIALNRSQRLSEAEGAYLTAAQAATIRAHRKRKRKQKLNLFAYASDMYKKAGDHDSSLQAATNAKKYARSIEERLTQRLNISKAEFETGRESLALQHYQRIAKDALKYKDQMDRKVFSQIYAETNFLLGNEAFEAFEDFKIAERNGTISNNIVQKLSYFDSLTKYYQNTIKSSDPDYRVKARYKIGDASEKLSQELNEIRMTNSDIPQDEKTRLKSRSQRLATLAKRYYSDNVLDNSRQPSLFYNNPYIKKSAIKLTGIAPQDDFDANFQNIPYSSSSLLPQQWSLK